MVLLVGAGVVLRRCVSGAGSETDESPEANLEAEFETDLKWILALK